MIETPGRPARICAIIPHYCTPQAAESGKGRMNQWFQLRLFNKGFCICISLILGMHAALGPVALGQSTSSAPPSLSLPLDCKPGVDCWIGNYMDDDPSSNAVDYACGQRTYDEHNGTDFAILDRRVMLSGVSVTAAAEGMVARLRDGMADVGFAKGDRASLAGRNCGNGVVLQHGAGWETQYCHLRQGSIIVRIGQHVDTGQKIGLVGLSGMTEFPHVHFTVLHNGQSIDPFVGEMRARQCGAGEHPLWRTDLLPALKYEPFAIYHAGFADRQPSPDAVRAGDFDATALSPTSPLIALWADIFGTARSDVLTMRIKGPDGATLVERRHELQSTQALQFSAIGRKRLDHEWAAGKYIGEIMLSRPGNVEGGPLERRAVREVEIQ